MRVFFFSTCLGACAFADTCIVCIKLLQKEGVEVVFKKNQTCCGQPSFNSGYNEETKEIALHTMDLLQGEEPIVVPSGSCATMMRVDYPLLFEGTSYEKQAKDFAKRVYELSEFLFGVLKVKYEDKGNPIKVTWHSNCHALRGAKCIEAAKSLLRSLKNVELIELEREEECCGFGGTFSIKEPEISNAMVTQKVQDIQSRGVDCLLSADSGCLLNISGAMQKQGVNIQALHWYDFLAQRIGL